jgi:hypothetical protein
MARTIDDTGVASYDDTDYQTPKPTTRSGLPSVYDQLRKELSRPTDVPKHVILKVPARPNISVKYKTDVALEQLDRWRVAARKNKKRDTLDVREFNSLILVSQCVGILFDGEEVEDENGDAITFRTQEFIESLGALEAKGAIKALYDRDADILRAGAEILKAAGYDDEEDDEEDPLD